MVFISELYDKIKNSRTSEALFIGVWRDRVGNETAVKKFIKCTKSNLYSNALKIFPELKVLIAAIKKTKVVCL
mgnify:FL=1